MTLKFGVTRNAGPCSPAGISREAVPFSGMATPCGRITPRAFHPVIGFRVVCSLCEASKSLGNVTSKPHGRSESHPSLLRKFAVELSALAAKSGLPTIGGFRESAQRGLLIGYGPSLKELGRQAADYVERIFNGAQAGELPFQGPTHFDFAINMRTAKALGLEVPPTLLARADEVIE